MRKRVLNECNAYVYVIQIYEVVLMAFIKIVFTRSCFHFLTYPLHRAKHLSSALLPLGIPNFSN